MSWFSLFSLPLEPHCLSLTAQGPIPPAILKYSQDLEGIMLFHACIHVYVCWRGGPCFGMPFFLFLSHLSYSPYSSIKLLFIIKDIANVTFSFKSSVNSQCG